MKLNQLRDMVAIVQQGSLRAAARHLDLAQPALTRSIRTLERDLGTALFEREARGMVLTTADEQPSSWLMTRFERMGVHNMPPGWRG